MTRFKPAKPDRRFSIASCTHIGLLVGFALAHSLRAMLIYGLLSASLAHAGSAVTLDGPPRLSDGVAASTPTSVALGLPPRVATTPTSRRRQDRRKVGRVILATGLVVGLAVGPIITAVGYRKMDQSPFNMDESLFFVGAGVTLGGLAVALIGGIVILGAPKGRSPRSRLQVRVAPTLNKRSRGVAFTGRF